MIGRTNASAGGTGGTLTVNAPSGVTVTVSNDGKSKTKKSGTDGVAVFKGLESGEWTVVISNGSQTAENSITITTDYAITMAFFAATINITYPAGSICTASDGASTLTAPDTLGSWACVVPNTGTWTVNCTDGSSTATDSVSITSDGESAAITLSYALYLYTAGQTSGFTAIDKKKDGSLQGEAPAITYGTSAMTCQISTAYRQGLVRTSGLINVTKHHKLTLVGSSNGNTKLCVWSSMGSYLYDNVVASVAFTGNVTLDISRITGNYYIGVAIESQSTQRTATIRSLYLS